MRTKRLGSSGPEISVVGYGAWELGGDMWGANPADEHELHRAIRAGIDAGMTWVDTAEVYGSGRSEEIVGRALAGRSDALVFTKVAPSGTGFRPEQIVEACDKSLRRLGRDAIDLYQLHAPDKEVPVEDTWGAMAGLVEDGKVRFIGVSNFKQDLIERCESVRHVDSLQPQISMLWRDNLELAAFCGRNGTGVIAYGPLAYGLLTGTITKDTTFADGDWRSGSTISYYERLFKPGVVEGHLAVVDALRPVADRLGCTLAHLALAWVVHQEGVTGAIAGSRDARHCAQNAGAGDVALGEKDLEEIGAILAG
ncbi:MAG TPA: aldo/keto reductase [Actinomycetota bacterium]